MTGGHTMHRGELIGAVVAGVAGAAWALWAAGGASGGVATAIRIVGVVLGLALVITAVRGMRGMAPENGGTLFGARGYRLTVRGGRAGRPARLIGDQACGATGAPGVLRNSGGR